MKLTAHKYKFSKKDASVLSKMGYQIRNHGIGSFEMFMQLRFTNFNLLSLLKIVEAKFAFTTNKRIHRIISFNNSTGWMQIEYYNEYKNEDDALLFVRKFINTNGSIEIKHEYCVIPKESRKKGLIKPVFQESLRQYINMNASKIFVHAGLSGGGYAWAKHGFAAVNKDEVNIILNSAKANLRRSDFDVVKKIYDIYYSKAPDGKSFPMDLWAGLEYMKPVLMGSHWHGELDLQNKEQLRNFTDYVFR